MCGLVGVAGYIGVEERKVFTDLLIMDQLRGQHSVGVMGLRKNDTVEVQKRAIGVNDFLDLGKVNNLILNSKILIGHNRYATQGKKNSVNAHPFTHGDITGVHNGTLRQQFLLPDHKDFEVDSDNIFHAIAKNGINATWPLVNGAAALVWWDDSIGTLNFIRNEERPLWYCHSEDGHTIFWASEKHMLLAATERRGVFCKPPVKLPIHMHTHMELGQELVKIHPTNYVRSQQPVVLKPSIRAVAPYKAPVAKKKAAATAKLPYKQNLPVSSKTSAALPAKANKYRTLEEMGYAGSNIDVEVVFIHWMKDNCLLEGYVADEIDVPVRAYCKDEKQIRKILDHPGEIVLSDALNIFKIRPAGEPVTGLFVSVNSLTLCEEEDDSVVSHIFGQRDHRGGFLTQATFDARYKTCGWCTQTLEYGDKGFYALTHDEGLCGDCSVDEGIVSQISLVSK